MLSANIKNKLKVRHTRVRESIRGHQNLMNKLSGHFADKLMGSKQNETAEDNSEIVQAGNMVIPVASLITEDIEEIATKHKHLEVTS